VTASRNGWGGATANPTRFKNDQAVRYCHRIAAAVDLRRAAASQDRLTTAPHGMIETMEMGPAYVGPLQSNGSREVLGHRAAERLSTVYPIKPHLPKSHGKHDRIISFSRRYFHHPQGGE